MQWTKLQLEKKSLLEIASKAAIQVLYDKGLFGIHQNVDWVFHYHSVLRSRVDINEDSTKINECLLGQYIHFFSGK